MVLISVLLCTLVLSLASCQYQLDGGHIADYQDDGKHKASEYPQVTVCPEDYSPRDDCVTLDQLMSGNFNKSHTTFKFQPATFKLSSEIRFESVSNITLESAGTYKVDITCVGNNAGFIFYNVSGLTIQNMVFSRCVFYDDHYFADSTLTMSETSDIMLRNLTFRDGMGGGIAAHNGHGYFTIMNSLFTHMQGTGLYLRSTVLQTVMITNSQFDCNYYNVTYGHAYAVYIFVNTGRILLEDIAITNNAHRSDSSGIFISSNADVTVKRINYTNNLVIGDQLSKTPEKAEVNIVILGSAQKKCVSITDSNFISNSLSTSPVMDIEDSSYGVLHFFATTAKISIRNTTIANNTGAAILVNPVNVPHKRLEDLYFVLESSIIASNAIYVSDYYEKGAVQLKQVGNIGIQN